MQKKGFSIPLSFTEDQEVFVDKSSMKTLLVETYSGNLAGAHLAYICDCLTVGEHVAYGSRAIEDLVFSFADPEINGGFKSQEQVLYIINEVFDR